MSPRSRLTAGVVGLILLTALGTVGYILIEDASIFDSLYMVAITVTTIGFGEVFSLSDAGRALTLGIMAVGVGLAFYTAGAAIEQAFILGERRRIRRTHRMIEQLDDHVIVCGLGRVGRGTARALASRGIEVVAVEVDETRLQAAIEEGMSAILGDATHNDILLKAGISKSRALVACVTDDPDNVVIVLSARSLAPDLHIVSRASEEESEDKLRLAGADRVVAPQRVGSERLAAMAVERSLADVFDVVVGGRSIEFVVEELRVSGDSPIVGKSIRDAGIREVSGAMVLAVEDSSRQLLTTPSPDSTIVGDSVMIVVGTQEQVDAAVTLLGG